MDRISIASFLHPKFAPIAKLIREDLARAYEAKSVELRFEIFETFRLPARQADMLKSGTSKAGPWESAHQVGLACDFVPFLTATEAVRFRVEKGSSLPGWHWPPADWEGWNFLTKIAEKHGCSTPIAWDRPHVQHPLWGAIRKVGF